MTKVRQILRHHVQGAGSKQISKLTGVAWNVVKRNVRQFTEEVMTIEEIDRMSHYKLDMRFAILTDIPLDPRQD